MEVSQLTWSPATLPYSSKSIAIAASEANSLKATKTVTSPHLQMGYLTS